MNEKTELKKDLPGKDRRVQNILSKHIDTFDQNKVSLDSSCKKLLSNKSILAWILKYCAEEYSACSIKEIEETYIEGNPEISKAALHMDEGIENAEYFSEMIEGLRNENSSMLEGTVTYDVIFNAAKPPKPYGSLGMIVNIEAQTKFYAGYPLTKRGIYYGGRMISSQYGNVFAESHYEKLRKVYSIWICLNPPKYRRNSINQYSFCEKRLIGNVKEKKENYDLITVIMICLGDEESPDCSSLIRLLSVLFSQKKNAEEKKEILEKEFDIPMTEELREEMRKMCDYSDYVEELGIRKGRKEGRKEGFETGRREGRKAGRREGLETGRREGHRLGEQLMSTLIKRLFADGRTEDVLLAVNDEQARKLLYKEYGLSYR